MRILAAAALLGVGMAVTISRCDPRQPGAAAPPAADLTLDGGAVRRDLRFPCGDAQCAAWLYLPAAQAPPVVVMAHGFAGTRDVALPWFAERFARAGIAALVFDYRHFGASGGLPRQIVDPARQLDDWRSAIAWAREQPHLDGRRLALWGSSLGGGHALTVAATEPVTAVVAQAPLVDSTVEGEATFFGIGWLARLLLSGWGDLIASAYGGAPLTIAAIAPGDGVGMIADDAAFAAFTKLEPGAPSYRNAVAARSIFLFDDYNPAASGPTAGMPILLIASPEDRFAPYAAVEAYASRSPQVRIVPFTGDHFDVYSPPAAEQAASAAVEFLREHLFRAEGSPG
jgi:fermentation-respiration switch protein FrsA (DUF1100 family)